MLVTREDYVTGAALAATLSDMRMGMSAVPAAMGVGTNAAPAAIHMRMGMNAAPAAMGVGTNAAPAAIRMRMGMSAAPAAMGMRMGMGIGRGVTMWDDMQHQMMQQQMMQQQMMMQQMMMQQQQMMGGGMGFGAIQNARVSQGGEPYMSVQAADPNLENVGGARISFE